VIATFDLYHSFRQEHDSEQFYDWLGVYVKGRAVVYRTEGDDTLEDGTVVSWLDSEWTAVRAEFDRSDPELASGRHHFRYPGWQCDEYHLIRVLFDDKSDARHFAAQYGLAPESVDSSGRILD